MCLCGRVVCFFGCLCLWSVGHQRRTYIASPPSLSFLSFRLHPPSLHCQSTHIHHNGIHPATTGLIHPIHTLPSLPSLPSLPTHTLIHTIMAYSSPPSPSNMVELLAPSLCLNPDALEDLAPVQPNEVNLLPLSFQTLAWSERSSDDTPKSQKRLCYRHRPDLRSKRAADEIQLEELQQVLLFVCFVRSTFTTVIFVKEETSLLMLSYFFVRLRCRISSVFLSRINRSSHISGRSLEARPPAIANWSSVDS